MVDVGETVIRIRVKKLGEDYEGLVHWSGRISRVRSRGTGQTPELAVKAALARLGLTPAVADERKRAA
ncbi:MAG: hypothetical protein PHU25_02945 [Deltaproteobacteria bacterium]|nr:hypothetical protein [Deltaproteobacteria bacterium]